MEAVVAGPGIYVAAFVLGTLLGSFANVCIERIPRGLSIVRPGSHCFACQRPIRAWDNIPIVSWIVLRGRCRACGAEFSPRTLFVEAATGLLVLAVYHLTLAVRFTYEPVPHRLARFAIYTLFVFTLDVITFIDYDHKRIPDVITYPAIPTFYLLGVLLGDHPWWHGLIGIVVGYGVIRAVSDGYYWLTGREGLGYGDGKLLAMVGALFGWQAVMFSLFGGSLLGSIIGVAALSWQRRRKPVDPAAPRLRHVEVPFGPFLVAAAVVYVFLQEQFGVAFPVLPVVTA